MKQKWFRIEWEGYGGLTAAILQRVLDRWLAYISFFNIRVYEIDKKVFEWEENTGCCSTTYYQSSVDQSVYTCRPTKIEKLDWKNRVLNRQANEDCQRVKRQTKPTNRGGE